MGKAYRVIQHRYGRMKYEVVCDNPAIKGLYRDVVSLSLAEAVLVHQGYVRTTGIEFREPVIVPMAEEGDADISED